MYSSTVLPRTVQINQRSFQTLTGLDVIPCHLAVKCALQNLTHIYPSQSIQTQSLSSVHSKAFHFAQEAAHSQSCAGR